MYIQCVCVCVCVRACVCVCAQIIHMCPCRTLEVEVKDIIQFRGGVQLEFFAYLANNLRSHSVAAIERGHVCKLSG